MRAACLFLGLLLMPLVQAAEPARLLAAGSLEGALGEVVDRFSREHDVSVDARFGPSGTLRESIEPARRRMSSRPPTWRIRKPWPRPGAAEP